MDALHNFEIHIILALQQFPGFVDLMKAISFLGQEEFYLILMPILFWCYDATLGARLAVVLVASNAVNGFFKLALRAPRPYWVDAGIRAYSSEVTYGPPSAHAQNAVTLWGWLAAQSRQKRAWWGAGVLALLIAFSRVYLGMHFVSDVVLGWILGGLLLGVLLRWEAPLLARLRAWSLGQQLTGALAVSLVYLAVMWGLRTVTPPEPTLWVETARIAAYDSAPPDPRNLKDAATNAGLMAGLGLALALAHRRGRNFLYAHGPVGHRVLRLGVGMIGVLIVWRGLALILPEEPLWLGLLLRYGRYLLVGFWVGYLAPLVFNHLGWGAR
jgi:membrane-associated phospholipid phosphatase